MSRRSFATPLIVAILVTVAGGVTLSTADSSPAPVAGSARTTTDIPVSGLIVGHGLSRGAAADLSEAFPGWRVDVTPAHRAKRGASPVVVIALHADTRRWRPYLIRYASQVLPARATVVVQPPGHRGAVDPRRVRRTAALLSEGEDRRGRG